MADNVVTQAAAPATPAAGIRFASVEADFSGDTVQAGVGVLATSSGAEGARTLTLINPATSDAQTTGNNSLSSIDGKTPALGQALAAASVPVVLTAAQLSTLTPPAAITGFLTEADFDTKVGSLTEAAPGTDTASSGLNGRLQRIAQRITSLITALGSPFQAGGSIGNTSFASTVADGANAVEGATTGAAVTTDANGTLQQYLRGIVKLAITVGGWLVTAQGDTAHDGVDAGNPVKIGGKAASAAPTAVAAADRVNALFDLWGRAHVRTGAQAPAASTWTGVHVPATATQATKTQASAGSGKRNVCTGFTATLTADGTAPTPTTPVTIKIIDGASGGSTILWQTNVNMPATAGGIVSFNRSNIWLPGTAATAMTIEFSAASPTGTYQSVSFDGVIIEE